MKRFQYKIKFQIGIVLFLFLSVFVSGENEFPQENVKLTGKYYSYPIGLDGSPYLQDEWQEGNLNLENGKTAYNIKIRFNLINNDLIFYNEALKRVFVVDKETIKSFIVKPGRNDSLLFIKYKGPEVGFKLRKNDFVHVLYQGKISFMVKHWANIVNATDISSKDKVYNKDFYFVNFDKNTDEIKLNYRSIYNLFPNKKKEVKRIISENKIRKANERNLEILFNIIDNTPNF
jgi:hypothetical protein